MSERCLCGKFMHLAWRKKTEVFIKSKWKCSCGLKLNITRVNPYSKKEVKQG